ncbi:MAG: glutaminase A [Tissierellaceae bacterium]
MKELVRKVLEGNRKLVKEGRVADYIPALSKANPKEMALSLMDLEGNIYSAGDQDRSFTIQSISKVLGLILALRDKGEEGVFNRVGYEATDEPFNTMFKLDGNWEKPANPMINLGAIVTTSLIAGAGEESFNRILELIKKITGNPNISYDREVYLSERETGNRNRSMAYLLKSKGLLTGNVEDALDTYFKQCSILVTTVDLAKIGLFIARGCPFKEEGAISNTRLTSIVRAIMSTCGMYNFSGQYAVNIGIPSKSGVGGGILGTVSNKYGIGVYSPALDSYGNSAAGYGMMKDLSEALKLNIFI